MKPSFRQEATNWFYSWESLGRGWNVYEAPVHLEPPFAPFIPYGSHIGKEKPEPSKGFWDKLFGKKPSPSPPKVPTDIYDQEPIWFDNDAPIKEIGLSPLFSQKISVEETEQFLLMLSYTEAPVSFEIIGLHNDIQVQLACREHDYAHIKSQIGAYFPETIVSDHSGYLQGRFTQGPTMVFDLALEEEFMRPLAMTRKLEPDLLAGLTAAMENLYQGELLMVQVLFQSAVNPWAQEIIWSVSDGKGSSFFVDSPEMVPLAKEKVKHPLFGVVIRVMAQGQSMERTLQLGTSLIPVFQSLRNPGSNSLVPIDPDVYPVQDHIHDALHRQSRRTGMLLNTRELVSLVHLPTPSVNSKKLNRSIAKTNPSPLSTVDKSLTIGTNTHQGITREVSLELKQRLRHLHLIGATGTGKSTLLLRMMVQDIEAGHGLTVLDPHGDLIDTLIGHIPVHRVRDVVYLDPADAEYPVGLNFLQAHSEIEKIVLSSDMVGMFRRLATSWGDQMTSVLANAIAAILESSKGGTLLDLRRFLVEKSFRASFLETVTDPHIVYYWQHEFPMLRSNSIGPLITRLNTFLRPKLIRNMMAQKSGIDFNEILDKKKIFLAKLSQGFIGEENSYLLGTLLVAKMQQAAQARQAITKDKRHPHFLYIDEFQNFLTSSMGGILSGARKYGLGLILAHQDLQQLFKQDSELGNSVISNPGTRICFRLGDFDAKKLESGFAHFDQADLQSLGIGEAIARVGQLEHDFNLQTQMLPTVPEAIVSSRRDLILQWSRMCYAKERKEVEQKLWESRPTPPSKAKNSEPKVPEKPLAAKPHVELVPKEPVDPIPVTHPTKLEVKTETPLETAAEAFKQQERERKEVSEHIYLQTYIKRIAEARGFRSIIEKPTPDGKGRVDVSLERDQIKIAIEISVTTPAKHELHNITKCLKAKYQTVISTSKNKTHLDSIEKLSQEKLSKKQLQQVKFFAPEEIVQYLDRLTINKPKTEQRMKGYRVKVKYNRVSEIEAKRKQGEIARTVVESLKKKG